MIILFEESFEKDLRKIRVKKTKQKIREIIAEIKSADAQKDIRNLTTL